MKRSSALRHFLCIAGSALLAVSSAHAASGNWNDNTGNFNWSDATRWSSDPTVPGTAAGDAISFANDITAARTITVNTTNRTMGTLNIGDTNNSNQFIIASSGGGLLIFDNGGSGAAINETGTVAGGTGAPLTNQDTITAGIRLDDNLAISTTGQLTFGAISETGTRSITKTGAGGLDLNGAGTYSGGFNLNQGTAFVNAGSLSAGVSSAFGTGKLTIASGTTINAAVSFQSNNAVDMTGTVNLGRGTTGVKTWTQGSAGAVTLTGNTALNSLNNGFIWVANSVIGESGGARSLTLSGNTMTATLNAANTYSGGTTTGGQTLNINHSGSGGTSSAIGTGALNINGGTINNTSGNTVTLSTNNAVNISSNFTFTGSHDLNLGTGAIFLNGNRQITISAGKLTMGGTLTAAGAQGWNKLGGGILTLTATNSTNTGRNTITTGVVEVSTMNNYSANSSLGAQSSSDGLWIAGGSTLRYIGGTDVITNRGFTLSSAGGSIIESSGLGTLSYGTPTNTLAFNGANLARGLVLGGTNTGANTFGKNLPDNGSGIVSLSKEGSGKWILTGTNGYSGTTTVTNGTLEVSAGNINNTSSVAINGGKFNYGSATGLTKNVTVAGGEFRYNSSVAYSGALTFTSGKISGTNLNGSLGGQTIGTGQTISPGNSPGTAVTTSQTWAPGGSYEWEINSTAGSAGADPGWDLINGTEALAISASLGSEFTLDVVSLTLANAAGAANGFNNSTSYNWLIADFASITGFAANAFLIDTTAFSNPFTGTFGVALGNTGSIGGDDTQIFLTYTAVPEPRAALLGTLGLLMLLRRRR